MINIINVLSEELKPMDEAGRVLSYSFQRSSGIGMPSA